jgi:ABC-type transport system involved in multi-copper enzyme maturation permease subunit
MKKFLGVLLVSLGAIFIVISILSLVKAFDIFNKTDPNFETLGYIFGSVLFPLLLTVLGRWIFRKGFEVMRRKN